MKEVINAIKEELQETIINNTKTMIEEVFEKLDETIKPYEKECGSVDDIGLEKGKKYYTIDGFGEVLGWTYDGHPADMGAIAIGNIFRNIEEAEFELEKRKVVAGLKRYSCNFMPNSKATYIVYSCATRDIRIFETSYIKQDTIYFKDKETAELAIEKVGEDRILKYLFRAEE